MCFGCGERQRQMDTSELVQRIEVKARCRLNLVKERRALSADSLKSGGPVRITISLLILMAAVPVFAQSPPHVARSPVAHLLRTADQQRQEGLPSVGGSDRCRESLLAGGINRSGGSAQSRNACRVGKRACPGGSPRNRAQRTISDPVGRGSRGSGSPGDSARHPVLPLYGSGGADVAGAQLHNF